MEKEIKNQDDKDEEDSQNRLLQDEARAEWLNTTMKIEVTIHDNSIYRNFTITDGEIVPLAIMSAIEEMKETLLDTSEL